MDLTPQISAVIGVFISLLGAVVYFARSRRTNGSDPDPRSVIRLAQKANRTDCQERKQRCDQHKERQDAQLAESLRATAREHMARVKSEAPPDDGKAGDDES